MTRSKWTILVAVFMAFSLFPAQSQGQNLAQVWEFTPKSGSGAGFEEALKAHMKFRAENGDPWSWEIYQVVVGDNVGDYYARSGAHAWADFDAYQQTEFAKVAGPHYQATVAPLVEANRTWIDQADTTVARLPADMEAQTLFSISEFYLVPGQQIAFNQALAKFHEAMVEADAAIYYSMNYPVAGGSGPMVTLVGFSENWAGFADPDPTVEEIMMEKYGEEEATEIFEAFGGAISSTKNIVLALRVDLSGQEGM